MNSSVSTRWIIAGGVAADLALGGCARDDATKTGAGVAGQTGLGQPLTATPPPTYAQQYEQRLVALGATHADQGLVLMLNQPAVIDRVADLLKERRTEIAPGRVRTGDGTDQGPLQFVLADEQGRFESQLGTIAGS